jgi:hypothetical protein
MIEGPDTEALQRQMRAKSATSGEEMKRILILVVVGVCSCASPRLPIAHTAADEFAALHGIGQRTIAHNFYDYGQGDATKRLYWAQRRAQETGDPPSEGHVALQRKYITVKVPGYQDVDGTIREPSLQTIEVVEFYSVVPRPHGGRLFLCR